jgi:Spy/CpxP family protein refolding chaperone
VNTWKVIFATLVIFGAGVLTGGLLVSYSDRALHHPVRREALLEIQRERMAATNAGPRENRLPPPWPLPLRRDFLDRLDHELKITPPQRERIEKIIAEGQDETREIWLQVEPDMHRAWTEVREKIRGELRPEQQVQFEKLLKQRPHNPQRPPDKSTNLPPAVLTNPQHP